MILTIYIAFREISHVAKETLHRNKNSLEVNKAVINVSFTSLILSYLSSIFILSFFFHDFMYLVKCNASQQQYSFYKK